MHVHSRRLPRHSHTVTGLPAYTLASDTIIQSCHYVTHLKQSQRRAGDWTVEVLAFITLSDSSITTSCAVGEVAIVNDLIAQRGLTILGARLS